MKAKSTQFRKFQKLDLPIAGHYSGSTADSNSLLFGIELELENFFWDGDSEWPTQKWMTKPEGSLRNGGIEIVSVPLPYDTRVLHLKMLEKCIATSSTPPVKSIRCSTHIHISVLPYTLRNVLHSALAYYLLENTLVRTQHKNRQGNLFCLRMTDARMITRRLLDLISNPDGFGDLINKHFFKYSAMNLATIRNFGTVEFRFFSPMTDHKEIAFWVECLTQLFKYGATKEKALDVISDYDNLPLEEFYQKVFGKENGKILFDKVSSKYPGYAMISEDIHKNYDDVVEIAKKMTEQKFELPQTFWDPDTALDTKEYISSVVEDEVSPAILAGTVTGTGPLTFNQILSTLEEGE